MASPLQLAQYVQQQGEIGRQLGTQSRLAQLAGQAYGAPAEQQRGYVQQAIATDPDAGFAMGQNLQDDRTQRMQGLSQKARMLVAYHEAGNRAGVDGLYPQLAQEAQQLGLGQSIPSQWDESYLPGMQQLASLGGGAGNTVQSRFVGDDGMVYSMMRDGQVVSTGIKADRQMWLRDHPGMAPHLVGKDASITPVGGQAPAGAAPGSAQAPVPQGGGFGEDSLALATQMIAAGIPAEQVDAFLQARMNPAEGQPAQATQQPPAGGQLPPRLDYIGGGLARPSEAQTAAEVEAARQAAQLAALPQRQLIEAEGAGLREGAVQDSRTAAERRAELPLARSSTENAKNGLARMAQTAREIRDNPALVRISGLMGQIPDMPGSPAANLRAQLENTLRSQVGFGVLQAMRDASKTGGALGQVSNVENILLQENLAALANTQSAEALKQQLDKIIQYAEDAQERLDRAFRETYQDHGGRHAPAPSDGPAQPSSDIDSLLDLYR